MPLSEKDHLPLKEIGGFIAEMAVQYDEHALRYAIALYLHYTENGPRPVTPPMHGFMAKAIREVVLDTVQMGRRTGLSKRAAA